MIEALAILLALFSAGIFAAHAVDAYTQVTNADEAAGKRENREGIRLGPGRSPGQFQRKTL